MRQVRPRCRLSSRPRLDVLLAEDDAVMGHRLARNFELERPDGSFARRVALGVDGLGDVVRREERPDDAQAVGPVVPCEAITRVGLVLEGVGVCGRQEEESERASAQAGERSRRGHRRTAVDLVRRALGAELAVDEAVLPPREAPLGVPVSERSMAAVVRD